MQLYRSEGVEAWVYRAPDVPAGMFLSLCTFLPRSASVSVFVVLASRIHLNVSLFVRYFDSGTYLECWLEVQCIMKGIFLVG